MIYLKEVVVLEGGVHLKLSQREQDVLVELSKWEERIHSYESNYFEKQMDRYYDKGMSLFAGENKQQLFALLDSALFHIHTLLLSTSFHQKSVDRMLSTARIFHEDIRGINDMRKLSIDQIHFIGQPLLAKNRLSGCILGGLSAKSPVSITVSDLVSLIFINLRSVQISASLFGNITNSPFEIMTMLKVFNAACLPKNKQSAAWNELLLEWENASEKYFYEASDQITTEDSLQILIQHAVKSIVLKTLNRTSINNRSTVSRLIGAGVNYKLANKVSEFSYKYYQTRFLLEKQNNY